MVNAPCNELERLITMEQELIQQILTFEACIEAVLNETRLHGALLHTLSIEDMVSAMDRMTSNKRTDLIHIRLAIALKESTEQKYENHR
jgi:hypothetical protein